MRYRYCIFYSTERKHRPYVVIDIKEDKTVGTFSTFEKAKTKYPHSHDYTWIGKGEI